MIIRVSGININRVHLRRGTIQIPRYVCVSRPPQTSLIHRCTKKKV